ncbi:MAG: hypothetical protein WKF80_10275 [Thermomicrobiales bacterium]
MTKPTTDTVPVYGPEIRALAKLTPEDTNRPALNGIRLAGEYAYAADGYVLMGAQVRREVPAEGSKAIDPGAVTLDAHPFAAAVKSARKNDPAVVTSITPGMALVHSGITTTGVGVIDHTYPDLTTVIAGFVAKEPVATITVSAELLAALLTAVKTAAGTATRNHDTPVTLAIYDDGSPVAVKAVNVDRDIFGFLMPMTCGENTEAGRHDRIKTIGTATGEVTP